MQQHLSFVVAFFVPPYSTLLLSRSQDPVAPTAGTPGFSAKRAVSAVFCLVEYGAVASRQLRPRTLRCAAALPASEHAAAAARPLRRLAPAALSPSHSYAAALFPLPPFLFCRLSASFPAPALPSTLPFSARLFYWPHRQDLLVPVLLRIICRSRAHLLAPPNRLLEVLS